MRDHSEESVLPRFYASTLPEPSASQAIECELDPEEARHAFKALRLEHDSPLELVDGRGHLSRGRVLEVSRKRVVVRVESTVWVEPVMPVITVATAVPKGSRAEDLIDMLVQTGAGRWVPLETDRAVVHPDERRRERWERRALAGLKQSRRLHGLEIGEVQRSDDLAGWTDALRLLADTRQDAEETATKVSDSIAVAIGPEGGWSARERELLLDAGWLPWSMGAHVMRVETAAAAASAMLGYLNRPLRGT